MQCISWSTEVIPSDLTHRLGCRQFLVCVGAAYRLERHLAMLYQLQSLFSGKWEDSNCIVLVVLGLHTAWNGTWQCCINCNVYLVGNGKTVIVLYWLSILLLLLLLLCTLTNKRTIISQIITRLHVSTLSCHPQTACNQHLAQLHQYFKCSCR